MVGHLAGSLTEPTAIRPVRAATLVGLYVRPEHRGARAGARLVEAFLEWAPPTRPMSTRSGSTSGRGSFLRP
ncbi:GNAT family N-acetyltransferase [Streptomyces sp. NPDC047072]|uniref:GNAT family N-acetyltransferase n=1 Tax=Streptomyces sp. NPDC047072 TaxID=3154809 RepID=UPI00340AC384